MIARVDSEFGYDIYSATGEISSELEKQPDSTNQTPKDLPEEEKRKVAELKEQEAEVIAHERAHKAAGGQYVRGGVKYEYETGPDGKRYIAGGEVSIDVSPEKGDPEETIRKMQTVRKAALAPAKPSKQDRAIAAEASRKENEARLELLKKRLDENKTGMPTDIREAITYDHSGRWLFYGAKKGSNLLNMIG